ncbi:MAG: hypothetical protein K2M00_02220, partial [Muribaculaceae bacterium]|nr:hypothetical protein [Muribaculaceae bacterium]
MRTLLCLLLSTLGLVNALQVSAAPVSPYADFPPVKATSTNTVATIHVHVSGLEEGDKAVLSISSNEYLDAVEINAPGDFTFANVPAGEHTVGLKADGYTVSNALTVEVTSDGTVKPYTTLQFAMTKDSKESDDFHFV